MEIVRRPGEAAIEKEFILPAPKHETSNSNDITAKKETTEPDKNENKIEENKSTENKQPSVEISEEPPKKKKRKGQNKARGRTVPKVENQFRVCPAFKRNEVCQYGENCKFLHDIEKYMQNKPADIGSECVNYSLTGKCRFGIECRYAKDHIDENYKNLVDEVKFAKYSSELPKDNSLSKELMIKLRKHQYNFVKTDKYLKSINFDSKYRKGLTSGVVTDEDMISLAPREKKKVDFNDKLFLAPLTTVGNLPYRRICKQYGADITCGEMAMSTNLLQGHQAEWALVKRHACEDVFGVQICGGYPDTMTKVAEMLNREANVDFIDINMGCPIDLVFKRGEGSALMGRMNKLKTIVEGMVEVSDIPITIKFRTGIYENKSIAHKVIPTIKEWGVDLMTLHGRSREQRYTRAADWEYINECANVASPVPFYGNGDILSFEDANLRRESTGVSGLMIARGALIKPWIFTEIKEQRHWDISSHERFEILRDFTNYGLEHWGSDDKGVENTRRFLLEWLSFLHRYIPVGLLESPPQKINERPPLYVGRDDLETLMASRDSNDWVKISEMLLGPVPENFNFLPKHKANSYS